jgi:hypothetical protein
MARRSRSSRRSSRRSRPGRARRRYGNAVSVTPNERDVLRQIAESEYRDWDLKDPVWSYASPPRGCTKASLGGIFSSLVKKGLLRHDGFETINDKPLGIVSLTDAGIAELPAEMQARYAADIAKYGKKK